MPRRKVPVLAPASLCSAFLTRLSADSHWSDAFSVDTLRRNFSWLDVTASQSFQIKAQGKRHPCPGVHPVILPLGRFMERMQLPDDLRPEGSVVGDPFYVRRQRPLFFFRSVPLVWQLPPSG